MKESARVFNSLKVYLPFKIMVSNVNLHPYVKGEAEGNTTLLEMENDQLRGEEVQVEPLVKSTRRFQF